MAKKTEIIQGTPLQIGVNVWQLLCNPVVCEAQVKLSATPKQMGQLYAGFLSAALGSMCADFGKEQAMRIARAILESVDKVDLGPGTRMN